MIGKNTVKDFEKMNYDEFYEHEQFEPVPDTLATSVQEVLPRFAWGYDQIEAEGSNSLLDLGCLDGSFCLSVSKGLGIPSTGIDLTIEGIDLANKRKEEHKLPCTFIQGKVEEYLKTTKDKFDAVTFFEVIEHVQDVKEWVKLVDRVLNPGGIVLFSTPHFEHHYGADDEENHAHVRLYTDAEKSYERENKNGTLRKATSIYDDIPRDRVVSVEIFNDLLHVKYR